MDEKGSKSSFFQNDHSFEAIFKSATEGILICSDKGRIVDANPAAHDIFGYKSGDLVGKSVDSLIPSKIKKRHSELRRSFHSNPNPRPMGVGRDLTAVKKNGEEFPIEVSLSHVEIDNVQYAIAFTIDISERKKIEMELRHSEEKLIVYATELERRVKNRTEQLAESVQNLEKINKELEHEIHERKKAEKEVLTALEKEKELNELKSRFVSMASHEFRTPLSTILSSASLIGRYTKEEMQENRLKHVKRIKENISDLTGILNDFLSLEKLEAGHEESREEKVELVSFINEQIDHLRTISKKGQSISTTFDVEKYELFIDKSFLKNILNNLISNAIKYSSEGDKIEVILKGLKDRVIIDVKDYGIGIPEEDQVHLFQRFFRAKNSMNIQGTGLGLNLVKRYLDLIGGSISFESKLRQGTTFTIILPNQINNK